MSEWQSCSELKEVEPQPAEDEMKGRLPKHGMTVHGKVNGFENWLEKL